MYSPPSGRYDGVQALRFIAAFMVVLTHATLYASERLDSAFGIWTTGARGVDIFFVISGFVIVIAAADRSSGGWVSPVSFLLRRVVRIVPMYWFATTLNLAILIAVPALVLHSSLDWGSVLRSYFFIPDYNDSGRIEPLLGVGWTLYFETFFYALFALSLFVRINPLVFVPTVLIGVAVASLFRQPDWPAVSVYLNPIVLEFMFGMAIAFWARSLRTNMLVAVAVIALGFFWMFVAHAHFDHWSVVVTRGLPAALIVLGFILLEPHVDWSKLRLFVFLGAASYVLYLFHPLIAPVAPVLLARLGLINPWLSVLLSATIAVAFSVVAHRYLEAPVLRLMGKWVRSYEGRSRVITTGERDLAPPA